ncbi:MAG: dual specificity protein phosphatase family protein [Tunicatimonas sp.]
MYTKIYWIKKFDNGAAVGIMPRPRGNDWLDDEIKRFEMNGIQTIVSLLEPHEHTELGLNNEDSFCRKYNINFINYPIPDRGLPENQQTVNQLIEELRNRIDQGQRLVIHCRMGIGRSSMISAAVLIKDKMKVDEIFDEISQIRGLKVPDTEDQIDWLKRCEG